VAPSTDLHPTWSPDGGRIVFESDRGGSADLYVADLVSGAVQQLTDTPSDDARPDHDTDVVLLSVGADGGRCEELLGGRRGASNVQRSRSNGRLAFNAIWDGDWEIYTAASDGSDLRRLTTSSGPGMVGIDGQPEWSPDGERIAVTSGRAGSLDVLLLWAADGSVDRNLTGDWVRRSPAVK
jgi:TolB protein